jgi:protein TonB
MATRALALREGIAPVKDRLFATLFLAGVLHALVILGVTFNVAAENDDSAPGLEVLLVSEELPTTDRNESAAYLAQRTQLGSGNTKEQVAARNRSAKRHVAGREGLENGDARAVTDDPGGGAEERLLTTRAWSTQVHYLAEAGESGSGRRKPQRVEERAGDPPSVLDDQGPAQLRGPRRDELWVSPDSRAATLAPYLDAWRRKVERIGTLNYPVTALSRPGIASPVLEVAIGATGALEKVEIRKSSGIPELDQAALEILKLASPFDPFPAALAREYRLLRFAYEWQFVGGRVSGSNVRSLP